MGGEAGEALATGARNVLIGKKAGEALDTHYNVMIGYAAGYTSAAIQRSVFIGYAAGADAAKTADANGTVAIGDHALNALTSGAGNLAIGYEAGATIATGANNTILGYGAMDEVPAAATSNVAIGVHAMGGNSDGNTASNYNVAIGHAVMNEVMDNANQNTGVGYNSMGGLTEGDNNACFGKSSGDVITTGTQNTILGSDSDPSANNSDNEIVIGCSARGHGSNIAVIGNDSTTAWHPADDAGVDLGSAAYRFANLYTADLQLSNEDTPGNEVDGTTGNWTLQEGQDDIFIINRKTGKKYKFKLEEVE